MPARRSTPSVRVVAEVFKLAALFVSGTFLIPEVFAVAGWQVYVFALVR